MSSSEAVVPSPAQQKTVRDLLRSDDFRKAVAAALPSAVKPDRFVRVAYSACTRQPELLKSSKESLFKALLDLASLGIEPDGRRAHLIPFQNTKTGKIEVQLILDYKGILELLHRSGDISYVHADVVYPEDDFSFSYGTDAHLRHTPKLDRTSKRPICAYSYVRMRDGGEDFCVMSIAEVEKIRSQSRAAQSGPWRDHFDEMAKKTVFRRHSKWLPLSPETREAIERDDEMDFSVDMLEPAAIEAPSKPISLDSIKSKPPAKAAKSATQPALQFPEVHELPDAFEYPRTHVFRCKGKLWTPNEDHSAWNEVSEAEALELAGGGPREE